MFPNFHRAKIRSNIFTSMGGIHFSRSFKSSSRINKPFLLSDSCICFKSILTNYKTTLIRIPYKAKNLIDYWSYKIKKLFGYIPKPKFAKKRIMCKGEQESIIFVYDNNNVFRRFALIDALQTMYSQHGNYPDYFDIWMKAFKMMAKHHEEEEQKNKRRRYNKLAGDT